MFLHCHHWMLSLYYFHLNIGFKLIVTFLEMGLKIDESFQSEV